MDAPVSLEEVLAAWPKDQIELRRFFEELTAEVRTKPGVRDRILFRPGVSYSFRAALARQRQGRNRPVFFLTDVALASNDPWFLSVCFYEDEISDPDELGNAVPQGLFGETGYCFDVDDYDPALWAYLKGRLAEAYRAAAGRA